MYFKNTLIALLLLAVTVSSWATTHVVNVRSNSFSPAVVVIKAGDTVRWVNDGTGSHNIFSAGRFRCAEGCDANAGNGAPSNSQWQAEVTFRNPETVPYECQPHVKFGMVGTVVVLPPEESEVHQVYATVDNEFSPSDITIEAGQVVHLINQGGEHNFRTEDGSLICADGCENDGMIVNSEPSGFSWEVFIKFNEVGEIPFHCANPNHSSQMGVIRILSDAIFVAGFE